MSNSADSSVTCADLVSPVRRLLRSNSAEVVDWDTRPVGYASTIADHSLTRISGHAQDHGQIIPWTLVLKVIRPPTGEVFPIGPQYPERPPHWGYWAAEPLAYASGLLNDLPGIGAPRCFGVTTSSGGSVCLWLEEIRDDVEGAWPLARYGLAARHFGRFNGAYLTGRPLPSEWWVGQERCGPREALPTAVFHVSAARINLDATWDHPLVRKAYPASVAKRLRRLWADNDEFFAAARRLPRTLSHYDAFRPNLFARRGPTGEDQTFAIDWSYLGIGAVGEELAAMVASTLGYFEFDGSRALELGETAFEGYLAGLRDVGWTGDAMIARLGYTLAVARYAIIYNGVQFMADEALWEQWRPVWGRPLDDIAERWPPIAHYLLDRADEARRLIAASPGG